MIKTQPYPNFWQRIHNSAKNRGSPLRVMFELTYGCNFHCKHCYIPESYKIESKDELKTKEVFSILDQLKKIGCFYLGFTGGEPFLREDIFDILWHAKKNGFQVIIYTNGSLIDEDKAGELRRIGLNKVDITIPAMSEAAFERISGVAGSHDKVFRAISLLSKHGIKLGFKTCVLEDNESEIKGIKNFAASLGALHRLDTVLSARLDGSCEPYKYRGNYRKKLVTDNRLEITDKDNCEDRGLTRTDSPEPITHNLFKCGAGVSQAAINPLGELKMCVMIDYPKYNILDTSLRESWQKLKKLAEDITPDEEYKCVECRLQPYCKWCPAKAWLYNKNFTICEPESRYWAEQRKRNYENRG
jgi:radical SAM protein with 4Fe4S-binding SPASM domain